MPSDLKCPKCKASVSASDYFTTAGRSDWRVESVGVSITCSGCGYQGLPVVLESRKPKGSKKGK